MINKQNKQKLRLNNAQKNIKKYYKQEWKLTLARRSLYTLAGIFIKFKNTKNGISNSSISVRKHRSYNLFSYYFPTNFPIVPMTAI